jgi:hypothetical protein
MSHVDEGTIHALLDGAFKPEDPVRREIDAHLASCDECRAKYERERRLHARASDVLGQVIPDAVRVEPFERILAMRRGAAISSTPDDTQVPETAPGDTVDADATNANSDISPRRSFRRPLAYAATLMLAVTAAWFARQYAPRGNGPAETMMAPEAKAFADSIAPPPTIQSADAPQPKVLADRAPANEGRSRDEDAAGGERRRESAPVRQAVPPPPSQASGRTADSGSTAGLQRMDSLSRGGVALDEIVVTGAAGRAAPASSLLEGPGIDAFATRVATIADSVTWRTVTNAEAQALLGRTPVSIAGLPIDSLHGATADQHHLVRVTQHAPSGEPVQVFGWAIATAPASNIAMDARAQRSAAASPPPASTAEREEKKTAALAKQYAQVGGATVLVRAALPPDSLAALARRAK